MAFCRGKSVRQPWRHAGVMYNMLQLDTVLHCMTGVVICPQLKRPCVHALLQDTGCSQFSVLKPCFSSEAERPHKHLTHSYLHRLHETGRLSMQMTSHPCLGTVKLRGWCQGAGLQLGAPQEAVLQLKTFLRCQVMQCMLCCRSVKIQALQCAFVMPSRLWPICPKQPYM